MFQNSRRRYLLLLIPLFMGTLLILSTLVLTPAVASVDQIEIRQGDDPPDGGENPIEEDEPSLQPENATTIQPHFTITPTIHLKSRQFQPSSKNALDWQSISQITSDGQERVHILILLDFIPRGTARAELAANGLELLAYVPDYAWIASLSIADADAALALPGVAWAGALTVDDKLDPAIRAGQWGSWNRAPDGTAAIYMALHKDESLELGRQLVETYGGRVTGEVIGINLLSVELPQDQIRTLAAEDAVQWIEPAAPPLSEGNDGIRDQIGVNTVNAAPYDLDGSNIDVLVYDGGVAGSHVDFSGRLTQADSSGISEHATHVAGTVGGDGTNSALQGGTALQWRGMAPNVDLISYGYQWDGTGMLFYDNPGDIEQDWAQAQNSYGADLGTASLTSNIYKNYYLTYCDRMGNYGTTAVLVDQIARGGNSVVGIGDKYISLWCNGNERGSTNSCDTYRTISPPASAKNPIHVGASNTNNNTMTTFSSWGPTDDGRIKPTIVAGGCQSTVDFGITSTDNDPLDDYTTMCGCSMATPAVAGGIALMLQHYRDVYGTSSNFWPSTAKAILMQTAVDFGNPGPDYQWGYGQVDIHAAVDLISRRAFRQTSVDDDEIDVFTLVVPPEADEVLVSLAWDDFEATFNADPTLINDLDLELVAPDGTIWRPWVLNPSSPASNATRGVDDLNNQEQVQVLSTDEDLLGTWLVRVRGSNVPQGPQSYSLVCEGCQLLSVGACPVEISPTAVTATENPYQAENINADEVISYPTVEEFISPGEVWQRSLEGQENAVQHQGAVETTAGLDALDQAIHQGPEAVVALLDTLRGPALDLAMDEITKAMEQLAAQEPPPSDSPPITLEEERAAAEAQQISDAANRAQALKPLDFVVELEPAVLHPTPNTINVPNVDRTVGNGCTYSTIASAIAAAQPGDRLLIEGGRTFVEDISIGIDLILEGGYAGCDSGSSADTTIDGNDANRVITISGDGVDITMENLIITNGAAPIFAGGGGIYFYSSPTVGTLNLSNVDVYTNTAWVGGGLYIGYGDQVIGTDVDIYENTALGGGGVYLDGGQATFSGSASTSHSYIRDNRAAVGGGVYGVYGSAYAPLLNLPAYADVVDNQALTGSGFGGGVYMSEGTVSLADGSDVISNEAIAGGGVYLVTSTLTIASTDSEIAYNAATESGGGVYAQGSTINLENQADLLSNDTDTGSGGGAYLDNSTLESARSFIRYNTAAEHGGGVYATNGSTVDMELGSYACSDVRCSQLYANAANTANDSPYGHGGGIYAFNSQVSLDNTFVEINSGYLGGGLYLYNSGTSATVNNSVFARNNATYSGNIGDAVRIYSSASMSGNGNTFAYNNEGGAATGNAIGISGATLDLGCAIIWGHANSIDMAGQNVTYSDIEGGYVGTANLDINPLFVSAASQDYHLQSSSPVIDHCPVFDDMETDFENETRPVVRNNAATPYDMGADEVTDLARVGLNGASCAFATIQQAINAASDDDTIQVSAGTYFENIDILDRSLTIEGGYNSTCTTAGSGTTRVEGSLHADSTFSFDNSSITLRNLEIAWGGGGFGGGFHALGGSQITLDNVDLFNNHATFGGGIYVSTDSEVSVVNGMTADDGSEIHHNVASSYGGGVRVWGQFNGFGNYSDIYKNCAPHGGGFDVPGGTLTINASDVYLNEAVHATSQGGGIRVINGGDVTLSNGAFVYYLNRAYNGAGIYADNAQIYLNGGATTLRDNVASNNGGGVYLTNGSMLSSSGARIGQIGASLANEALQGAGIYASASVIDLTGGYIINNIASDDGAGIYADSSTLTLTGVEAFSNTTSTYGGAIFVNDSTLNIAQSIFQDNTAARGGAIYQTGTTAQSDVNNSLFHRNTSTGGFGAGIRTEDGNFSVTHVTLADNLGGAGYSQSNTAGFATNSVAWGNTNGGFWVTSGTLDGTCSLDQSGNAGSITDPQFVNPGAGMNYHLLGSSPAIDACTTGLATDLDGISRPFGSNYDMGAYEYSAGITFTPNHSGSGHRGTMVSYLHTLTNTGLTPDTFALSASSSPGWSVTTDPVGPVALSSGQSTSVMVTVTVPDDASFYTSFPTTVTATSSVDPTLTASVTDDTLVVPYIIYLPITFR